MNRRPRGVCPVCGDDVPLYGPGPTCGRDYVWVGRHRGAPFKAGCSGEGQRPVTVKT